MKVSLRDRLQSDGVTIQGFVCGGDVFIYGVPAFDLSQLNHVSEVRFRVGRVIFWGWSFDEERLDIIAPRMVARHYRFALVRVESVYIV